MINKKELIREVNDIFIGPLVLTSGKRLEHVSLRYEHIGPADAPVILVCHALTGNHLTVGTENEPGWWSGLIGDGKDIDTEKFQIITFNVLGGCDGSTGPTTMNPLTERSYQASFPNITVRDMVHAQHQALKQLKIIKIHAVIGGSLGGMQALEWGIMHPEQIEKLILLATTPYLSDYGIAFNHIAETAIKQDPNWNNGFYDEKTMIPGLKIARMVGMVTYRSPQLFAERFNRKKARDMFEVTSYLNYQGKKLRKRFDANSYLRLLHAMNNHDIGKDREGITNACKSLAIPVLALSYDKDLIYEPRLIKGLVHQLPKATHHHIQTKFGHDGFLVEFEKWGHLLKQFLEQK